MVLLPDPQIFKLQLEVLKFDDMCANLVLQKLTD